MARTLYLENGSTEYIFAGETEADKLRKIIREYLGRDCVVRTGMTMRRWPMATGV